MFARAAMTNTKDWVAQKAEIYFLTVLRLEVQDQGLVPSEASPYGLQMATFLVVFTWSFLCISAPLVSP